MSVIWYAITIYVVGIAAVLYTRPESMFQPGGMWKEFGLETNGRNTVFPFWMFAIVWSIFSYALATVISLFFSSLVLSATPQTLSSAPSTPLPPSASSASSASFSPPFLAPNNIQPISQAPQEMSFPATNWAAAATATAASMMSAAPKVPGYYVLNTATPTSATEPCYVYYGPEPPSASGGGGRFWMPMN